MRGRIQRYRKIKESTGIQQTILALHTERKKRRDLKSQLVYIVKLILKEVRECQREMECQGEPIATGKKSWKMRGK